MDERINDSILGVSSALDDVYRLGCMTLNYGEDVVECVKRTLDGLGVQYVIVGNVLTLLD